MCFFHHGPHHSELFESEFRGHDYSYLEKNQLFSYSFKAELFYIDKHFSKGLRDYVSGKDREQKLLGWWKLEVC
jgi:hypothetical protein